MSSGSSSALKSISDPRSTFSCAAMSRNVSPALTSCSLPGSGTLSTVPIDNRFGSSSALAWAIASDRTSNCLAIWPSVSPAWTVYETSRLRLAAATGLDDVLGAAAAGALPLEAVLELAAGALATADAGAAWLAPAGTTSFAPRTRWSARSEEHTSELQSRSELVCRLLLEKKKMNGFLFSGTRKNEPAYDQ